MSKTRVIVVEDEIIIAEDIKSALEKFDYEVISIFGSGKKAIEQSKKLDPDVILMDIMLNSDMNGIQAAEKIIKKIPVPIIFLTAFEDEETIHRAASSDFYGYLIKPFKEKELHAAIQMALNKSKIEKRIKASQNKYKSIFENIQDVYFEIDEKGFIKEMSYSIYLVTKNKREELLNLPFYSLFADTRQIKDFQKTVNTSSYISDYEVLIKDINKNKIPCSINARIFKNKDRIDKVIGSLRDIRERKLAEKKVQKLAEEWKTTFDSISDMVSIQDIDFRFVRVNKSFAEAFGKKPEYFIGKKCCEVIHSTHKKPLTCSFKKTKNSRQPTTEEYYEPKLNKYLEKSTSPIFDKKGNLSGIVHILKDITERKASEKTLLELQKAIETMHLGVTISDINGKIIYTNATEANIHGYKVEELVGQDIGIFSPPYLRNPLTIEEIKKLNSWIRESKNLRKDGTRFPVRLMSDVVKDKDGNIFGVVTTCEDLSEQKGKDKALTELRKAIETLRLGVTISDIEGKIIYTNLADAKMHGYEVQELIGRDIGIFSAHNYRKPMTLNDIKKLKGLVRESVNIRKDGFEFPVRLMSDVVKDNADNPIAIVTTCEDITERKKAEEEVKRLAAIVESTEDAIIGKTLDGIIISWNKGAVRVFGYKPEEIKSDTLKILYREDRQDEIEKIIYDIKIGKKIHNYESQMFRKDGKLIDVSLTISPIKDATGMIIGISTIARDISLRKKAERKLKLSEEKFRQIFDNIQDVYFEIRLDGTIEEVSPSIKQMSLYDREEVIGKSIYDMYAYPKERFDLLRSIIKHGRVDDFEIDLKDKDNSFVPCSVSAIITYDEKNKPKTLIGSMRNILDRKLAEEQLNIEKERIEQLNHLIPSSLFTIDKRKIITSWNKKIEEVTGFKAEEAIGKKCTFFAVTPCREECGLFSGKMKKPITCKDCIILTKDGRILSISKNADILRDKNGKVIGGIESFEDVTEKKIAAKKLADSEKKYRHLVENLENEYFFYEHDINRKMTYVSPSMKNILGYTIQEFVEHHIEYIVKSKSGKVNKNTGLCLQGKQQPTYEAEIYHKDGSIHTLEISEFPLLNSARKIIGVQGIAHDVTDQKKAEKIRTQLMQKLASANKELKDFAYVVSHDLKAPLRAISTLSNWILQDYEDKLDDDGKEQLNLLISRVNRMHQLIEGVLQYSRVGRITEEKVEVDLAKVVPEIIDLLAPPENIRIDIVTKLPEIHFENTRIRQLFQNLLSNAIKYMDKPQGRVEIGCESMDDLWKFYVKDNGPGIDKKHYDRIFQIFQALQSKDKFESTGIGLTTIKKIVEMYNGKIWVESELGKGSTFFFTLPKKNPVNLEEL